MLLNDFMNVDKKVNFESFYVVDLSLKHSKNRREYELQYGKVSKSDISC